MVVNQEQDPDLIVMTIFGLYLIDYTVCPRSSDPFYIVSYIHKMGH